jgi:hypothetical protein
MHRDLNDTGEDGKDLVDCLETFLKFNILVPKRMSQEIEAYAASTPLKEPVHLVLAYLMLTGGEGRE